jgi:hypothetical protein
VAIDGEIDDPMAELQLDEKLTQIKLIGIID